MQLPREIEKLITSNSKQMENIEAIMDSMTEKSNRQVFVRWQQRMMEEPEPIPDHLDVPDTKLFIGFDSLDYSVGNAVLPDINIVAEEGGELVPKSRCFTILGEKNSGKSVLSSVLILDNIVKKYHIPLLIIDPQNEFYKHKESLKKRYNNSDMKQNLEEYESTFNVQFEGYSGIVYRVGFDTQFDEEGIDASLVLTLSDFRDLYEFSKVEGIQSLLILLDVADSRPAEYVCAQILSNTKIRSFGDALKLLKGEDIEGLEDEEIKNAGSAFRNYLEEAILLGTVSKDEVASVDIIDSLINYDFTVIRSKLKLGEEAKVYNKYLTYIKIYLVKMLIDRTRFMLGNPVERRKSRLTHEFGFIVLIDEADSVCPESGGGFLKDLIIQLATKYRKLGVTVCLLSQNASLLNHVIQQQSDAMFVARLKSRDNIAAVAERGVPKHTIDVLRRLNVEKKNSLGLNVNEWCYISQQNDVISFYPAPPLSNFFTQTK